MDGFFQSLLGICLVIIFLKLIFCEIDGRRNNKFFNINYFLSFNEPFKYQKVNSMIFMVLIMFVIITDINIFSLEGLMYFGLYLCVIIIIDVISSYAYYAYGKMRFKEGINKSVAFKQRVESLKDTIDMEHLEFPEDHYVFSDICDKYINNDDHIGITSFDGGYFTSTLKRLPKATYLIDLYESKAKELLKDRNVRITSLMEGKKLPYKDGKLDKYLVYYSNFDKSDVKRVLKDGGLLLLHHRGDNHLKELNSMYLKNTNKWNKYLCSSILENEGFEVIDSKETHGKIRFTSLSSLLTYIQFISPEKVRNYYPYLSQYAIIDKTIEAKGFYDLSLHEFYIIARKK